mgnify:CR=1 FL=1
MKSINHIHIPRCSGIYIKSHIVNDLKAKKIPYFATNHGEVFPETFKDKKFISGHFGLTPLKYRDDLIKKLKEIFFTHINIPNNKESCWEWHGNIMKQGYGRLNIGAHSCTSKSGKKYNYNN